MFHRSFLLFLLFSSWFLPSASAAREVAFTLLFTGSHQGRLEPLEKPVDGAVGGVSRRRTLIEAVRREVGPDRVVLMDTGHLYGGSALSEATRGAADGEAYQLLGYDAVVLAPGDFRWGSNGLVDARRSYRIPWISANTVVKHSSQNFMRPYILRYPGARVGVIGFTRPDVREHTDPDAVRGLLFNDPSAVAKGLHSILKKDAEIFVALTHLGPGGAKRLAKADPYLHVIVAAPDPSGKGVREVARRADGVLTEPLVVHAPPGGLAVGRLDLVFRGNRNSGYKVVDFRYVELPVSSSVEPDAAMERLLDRHRVLPEDFSEVLGRVEAVLGVSREESSPLGNLAADALREAAGAEVALLESSALGGPLSEGEVARGDLYRLLPRNPRVVTFEVPGYLLRRLLERSLVERGRGAFLQVSGMTIHAGGEGLEVLHDGVPLQDHREYLTAVTDFLANGGEGYDVFPKLRSRKDLGISLRSELAAHLRSPKRLDASAVGEKRWLFESSFRHAPVLRP